MLSRFMCVLLVFTLLGSAHAGETTLETPEILLTNVGFPVNAYGFADGVPLTLEINGVAVAHSEGLTVTASDVRVAGSGTARIAVVSDGTTLAGKTLRVIPGWVSLFPPLFAFLLAFLTRSVIPSLFAGLLIGAWAINGMSVSGFVAGFFDTVTVYIMNAATDETHMSIMLFTLMIGGMVGIISRNGGMVGAVGDVAALADGGGRHRSVLQ